MEIADQLCHRTLTYIAGVQRHNYSLTVAQVNAYAARANRSLNTSRLRAALNAAVLPGETALVWMYRLGWIELHGPTDKIENTDTVTVAPLGFAALAALDEAAIVKEGAPTAIALDGDDPMALAKVIGRIAEMGPCALVDPYFGPEVFVAIAQRTTVKRVLTGPKDKGRLAAIEQALADYRIDRDFEVRVDEEDTHHDRYVIPDDGSVWALGTSVNGVGVRHSSMVEIKDSLTTNAIRGNLEVAWNSAKQLNPAPQTVEAAEVVQKAESEEGSAIAQPLADLVADLAETDAIGSAESEDA